MSRRNTRMPLRREQKARTGSGRHASYMFSCDLNGQGFIAATRMKLAGKPGSPFASSMGPADIADIANILVIK
jgi:hypothetical protein